MQYYFARVDRGAAGKQRMARNHDENIMHQFSAMILRDGAQNGVVPPAAFHKIVEGQRLTNYRKTQRPFCLPAGSGANIVRQHAGHL